MCRVCVRDCMRVYDVRMSFLKYVKLLNMYMETCALGHNYSILNKSEFSSLIS